jgi:hypothetical protein
MNIRTGLEEQVSSPRFIEPRSLIALDRDPLVSDPGFPTLIAARAELWHNSEEGCSIIKMGYYAARLRELCCMDRLSYTICRSCSGPLSPIEVVTVCAGEMNSAVRFYKRRPELTQFARLVVSRFARKTPAVPGPVHNHSLLDAVTAKRVMCSERRKRFLACNTRLRRTCNKATFRMYIIGVLESPRAPSTSSVDRLPRRLSCHASFDEYRLRFRFLTE